MSESQEDLLCACPTFNSYSSDRLAEIAARVTDEFRRESKFVNEENTTVIREEDDYTTLKAENDDDFQFSLVRDSPEIFYNGQVGPIFPIFNRDLAGDYGQDGGRDSSEIRIPLKNLFIQEREERDTPSSSSSEADELESLPQGTYCVWKPKVAESSPSRCKKSNSTGSVSKRWKFLDLLRRSNSDGKESYVFLTPKHREEKSEKIEHAQIKQSSVGGAIVRVAGKKKAKRLAPSPSAHEAFYVRNRAIKEGDKKKSYLPYRQDLVGFFANANNLTRTFPPF